VIIGAGIVVFTIRVDIAFGQIHAAQDQVAFLPAGTHFVVRLGGADQGIPVADILRAGDIVIAVGTRPAMLLVAGKDEKTRKNKYTKATQDSHR
jgi:hypothetical protein